MSDKNEFVDTIDWSTGESIYKPKKAKGVPLFYLILVAIVILFLIIFLIYLMSKDSDLNALDMMKNSEYLYYSDDLGDSISVIEDSIIGDDLGDSIIGEDSIIGDGI